MPIISIMASDPILKNTTNPVDLYRDTPVRLLGYANEVGESFRALVPVSVVRASYVIAGLYCVADTYDKTLKTSKKLNESDPNKTKKLLITASDTLIWQTLASVAIPGYTINRLCAVSSFILTKYANKLPLSTRKWTTTAIGLSSIPFIVKPIDHSVDFIMDKTIRQWIN